LKLEAKGQLQGNEKPRGEAAEKRGRSAAARSAAWRMVARIREATGKKRSVRERATGHCSVRGTMPHCELSPDSRAIYEA